MRTLLKVTVAVLLANFLGMLLYVSINSFVLREQNHRLRNWFHDGSTIKSDQKSDYRSLAYQKALRYIELIKRDFLLDGMLVNKEISGEAIDLCDSLLFSSLYFTSLFKIGLIDEANQVWHSIENSNTSGQWLRHPKCHNKPASRDMILGLFVAFSQDAANTESHLSNLIHSVAEHRGFFSNGTFDVSYLAPGVSEFFRILAEGNKINKNEITKLPYAFSTSEFSALTTTIGYRSHLVALQLWLEMELKNSKKYNPYLPVRSPVSYIRGIFENIEQILEKDRINWISQTLFNQDPDNLFYKFLRLKSADALSRHSKNQLLAELLMMPQFPENRLPENCDRKPDYLWQRPSPEYSTKEPYCTKTYNGVDYLWMAALLLENSELPEAR